MCIKNPTSCFYFIRHPSLKMQLGSLKGAFDSLPLHCNWSGEGVEEWCWMLIISLLVTYIGTCFLPLMYLILIFIYLFICVHTHVDTDPRLRAVSLSGSGKPFISAPWTTTASGKHHGQRPAASRQCLLCFGPDSQSAGLIRWLLTIY